MARSTKKKSKEKKPSLQAQIEALRIEIAMLKGSQVHIMNGLSLIMDALDPRLNPLLDHSKNGVN